ncbi:MAG: hypothetical protein ACREAA_21585, partial [Candidatus Polarisedimenticolia bacterium]
MTRRQELGILLMTGAWGFADGMFTAPSWGSALVVFAAGAALSLAGRRSAAFVTGMAAAQAALMVPLPVVLSHVHEIPGLAALVALGLRAAGVEAVDAAGRLLLPTDRGAAVVNLTGEMIALPMITRLAAATVMIEPGHRARWGAAILLGSAGRLVLVFAGVAAGAPVSALFEPAVTIVTFLPMLGLPRRTAARRAGSGREARAGSSRAALASVTL